MTNNSQTGSVTTLDGVVHEGVVPASAALPRERNRLVDRVGALQSLILLDAIDDLNRARAVSVLQEVLDRLANDAE